MEQVEETSEAPATFTAEQFEELQSENNSMKSKMDELLTETKKAKAAKRETEESARLASEEKAKAEGNFEQLFKSQQEKNEELSSKYSELKVSISQSKIKNIAMEISTELADGPNAKILSTFIAQRLKDTDDGLKVLDGNGNLTVSSTEDLKNEFKNNTDYMSLLKGNQASGGGAAGGKSGSATAEKTKSRADFDKLDAGDKSKFMMSGGAIFD